MTRTRATDAELATEIALVALSAVTAVSLCRLFQGWSFLPTVLLAVVASHLIAVGARRLGWGLALSAVASAAGLVLFVTLAFYRDTTAFGILPTRLTWHLATTDLSASWKEFATAVPLVPARTGYLVAACASLWAAAFLADGFAFRAAVGVESIVPDGIIFVFASALAAPRNRLIVTAAWLVAAALVVALHRSLRDEATGWLTGHRHGAAAAAARVGAVLGVSAAVLALVVGPALPGAGEAPLVDTRNSSGNVRQTVSPLVDIKGRLTNRSDALAFTVRSPVAAYWRLTALDDFDGRTWTSSRTYVDAKGSLDGRFPPSMSQPVQQTFTNVSLSSEWLPAAYAPVRLVSGISARYDAGTSTLITRDGQLQPGQSYTVVSGVPNLDAAQLTAAAGAPPPAIASSALALPADFPANLREVARRIVGNATTPYEKARKLQDFFQQNFTYDINGPQGSSTNAIEAFLQSRRGYCEQFAGTYAALARAVNLPARVAVGFTPGDLGPNGAYQVSGKFAHAWPEVWFSGIGWVPFEPTPGRGNPEAVNYTGVQPAQEGQPAAPVVSTPATTAVTTPGITTPAGGRIDDRDPLAALNDPNFDGPGASARHHASHSWAATLLVLLLVAVVLGGAWVALVPRLVRRRWDARRAAARNNAERVLVTWHETAAALMRAGAPAQRSETPHEFATRAARRLHLDRAALEELAEEATVAAYAGGDVPDATVLRTDEIRRELTRTLWERRSRWQRLQWAADPRPLVEPIPSVRIDDRVPEPVG